MAGHGKESWGSAGHGTVRGEAMRRVVPGRLRGTPLQGKRVQGKRVTPGLSVIAVSVIAIAIAIAVAVGNAPVPAAAQSNGTVLPGTSCPVYPADNVWNTPVTGLPVNAGQRHVVGLDGCLERHTSTPTTDRRGRRRSPTASRGRSCPPSTHLVPIRFTYASRATPGPYPLSALDADREGLGPPRHHGRTLHRAPSTSSSTPTTAPARTSTAGSGAIWNLRSDALRPAGWTSADAAGLPILPGLVNYDEVASGIDGPRHPFHRRSARSSPTCGRRATRPARPTPTVPRWGALQARRRPSASRRRSARPCARPSSPP